MNPNGGQNILDQEVYVTMSLCLESAQHHNLHQIEMEFFYPKQPWKSSTDYKNKEKEYLGVQGDVTDEDIDNNDNDEPNERSTIEDDDQYSNEKSDKTTIQITNLSENIQERDLRDLLEQFGPVSRIYPAKDTANDISKGFAVITFYNQKDAQKAMEYLCKMNYGILLLKVEPSEIVS